MCEMQVKQVAVCCTDCDDGAFSHRTGEGPFRCRRSRTLVSVAYFSTLFFQCPTFRPGHMEECIETTREPMLPITRSIRPLGSCSMQRRSSTCCLFSHLRGASASPSRSPSRQGSALDTVSQWLAAGCVRISSSSRCPTPRTAPDVRSCHQSTLALAAKCASKCHSADRTIQRSCYICAVERQPFLHCALMARRVMFSAAANP